VRTEDKSIAFWISTKAATLERMNDKKNVRGVDWGKLLLAFSFPDGSLRVEEESMV
jgi:hypothetical protein